MEIVDNLVNNMPAELKVALAHIADNKKISLEECVNVFLAEGVNTYPNFIKAFKN